jgi:luciferase family oxidoreductase group 1
MIPLSVLDLTPVTEGGDAATAIRNSRELAQHAERLGYKRFWLAEHHNLPGVASAATAVVIGHVADGTSTIRVGAGGIMLPNHAPLIVAEAFGTLAALYPDRIDLGVGRAPGTDQTTARALRRTLAGDIDAYPSDVVELMSYFEPARPGQAVQAVPGAGLKVPVWILGSSTYGAQLAAALGLPYAFASHFAPGDMETAIAIYRSRFEPSQHLDRPYVMLGLNVVGAETDAEARRQFTSMQQSFLNIRTGRATRLAPPVDDLQAIVDPAMHGLLDKILARAVVGSLETVRQGLADFQAKTGADEIIMASQLYDQADRIRSLEIVAEAHGALHAAALT